MSEIVWPVWSKNGNKLLKAGTIDGVKFSVIYKRCQKWSEAYMKRKFPDMVED